VASSVSSHFKTTPILYEPPETSDGTFRSNKLESFDLGKDAIAGYWYVKANYSGLEAKTLFLIESNELVKFELVGDNLIITNTGNTRYTKEVQILIGDTLGVRSVDLGVGEKLSFRLIAPDGNYNVRVSDGQTVLTRSNVYLTGEVIGFLDEHLKDGWSITSNGDTGRSFLSSKTAYFVYLFLAFIIIAFVLLLIEGYYRKKIKNRNKKYFNQ